jgi:hypothetical protein
VAGAVTEDKQLGIAPEEDVMKKLNIRLHGGYHKPEGKEICHAGI